MSRANTNANNFYYRAAPRAPLDVSSARAKISARFWLGAGGAVRRSYALEFEGRDGCCRLRPDSPDFLSPLLDLPSEQRAGLTAQLLDIWGQFESRAAKLTAAFHRESAQSSALDRVCCAFLALALDFSGQDSPSVLLQLADGAGRVGVMRAWNAIAGDLDYVVEMSSSQFAGHDEQRRRSLEAIERDFDAPLRDFVWQTQGALAAFLRDWR
jgi:hypothetical protein